MLDTKTTDNSEVTISSPIIHDGNSGTVGEGDAAVGDGLMPKIFVSMILYEIVVVTGEG